VHFRETIHPAAEGGARMTFDYHLRPGLATTTNALRLLAAVGLAPGPEAELEAERAPGPAARPEP
jgi:hypothetical protein